MRRKQLLESALIFVWVAVALAVLIYHFETFLLECLLPLFRFELNGLMPSFHIDTLDWKIDRNETVIALSATLSEYRVILQHAFPAGVSINVSTLAAHAWVHPVLIFSLTAAWPGIVWQRRPLLLLSAVPFIVLAEMLDIPLLLWGALEDMLYWQADPAHVAESFGSWAQHFLDGGGRYAVSIVLALLVIVLFRKFKKHYTVQS